MEEIINLVVNQGLAIAISIIVLYGGIQLMNIQIEKLKNNAEDKKHKQLIIERQRINSNINLLLNRTMLKSRADKISVFEFHNGEQNLIGVPFLKMSTTYEVRTEKISSQKKDLVNLPCSFFQTFLDALNKEKYIAVEYEDSERIFSPSLYEILESQGIKKSIFTKISCNRGLAIGFIGMHTTNKNAEMAESDLENIKNLAIEVGALLSLKKRKNQNL